MTTLRKRIASAFALVATALVGTWLGGTVFAVMVAAVGVLMTWEWGRMVRADAFDLAGGFHLAVVIAAAILAGAGQFTVAGVTVVAGAIAVWRIATRAELSAIGVLYVGSAAVTLIALRDGPVGLFAVIYLFVCVWTTDTFAMITGKAIRGPQLFPSISPNKTWAGAIGGLAAASLASMVMLLDGSWVYGLASGALISLAAQLGDLFESWVKRQCGVKDTSGLIPGHGGVLDRMDGIVGAALFVGAALVGSWLIGIGRIAIAG